MSQFDDIANFNRVYEAALQKTPQADGKKMSRDTLENEALLIIHHVNDAEKAVKEGDLGYISRSLADIKESAMRLSKFLPIVMRKELERATSGD